MRQTSRLRAMVEFLPNLLSLFRGLLGDPRVPRRAKVLLWLAIAWLVSPIDLIPEFIPILGSLDDVLIAAFVVRYLLNTAGDDVITERWRGSEGSLRLVLRLAGAETP